jgi:hypothetical protein
MRDFFCQLLQHLFRSVAVNAMWSKRRCRSNCPAAVAQIIIEPLQLRIDADDVNDGIVMQS